MSYQRHWARKPSYRALLILILVLGTWLASAGAPTLAAATAQAAPPPLPPPLDLDAIAAQTAAIHDANGGATVNLYRGDLAGQDLYVVVIYPELSEAIPGPDLDPARIRQFIADHLTLLMDTRNNVGTWFDDEDGYTYLDVSTALPDRAQALALGQQYDQMGVFDLARMTTIELGGSGTPPANLPPIEQRLPPVADGASGR
jgi:hypothetical protein